MNEPILDRYVSYRAVPAPDGGEEYGTCNWRMTEHWWRQSPFPSHDQMEQGTGFAEIWPVGYTEVLSLPKGEARSGKWAGSKDGAHPPVFVFVTRRPTQDFHGKGLTMDDGTILRWVQAIRYPEGVSREEGDDWYINIHAPEVCKQPGLKRFFSFGQIAPKTGPFVRVSELWYENADAWRRAVFAWIEDMTLADWKKTLQGEPDLVFLACKEAWPHLKKSGAASIINFASANAYMALEGSPALAHCVGKGGVPAMTRQLAMGGGPRNIRANTISPGLIVTPATSPVIADPKFLERVLTKKMIKRVGYPKDIAMCTIYLASDEAGWVTAWDFSIDGGATAW